MGIIMLPLKRIAIRDIYNVDFRKLISVEAKMLPLCL